MPSFRPNQSTPRPGRWPHAPRLSQEQIVAWAKAHFERFGRYPSRSSGPILDAPGETWLRIHAALYDGNRGFRGGETLSAFLRRTVGKTGRTYKLALSIDQIVAWARAHHDRTGRWPAMGSGRVLDARGENWSAIDQALKWGRRGLPKGTSLSRLLDKVAGTHHAWGRLTASQVVAWAKAHRARTGQWPTKDSGPIPGAPGETWTRVYHAFYSGGRGLRGDETLSVFLRRTVGRPRSRWKSNLSVAQIVAWARDHFARTGQWPAEKSGRVIGAASENWTAISAALKKGWRGLPQGGSLSQILDRVAGPSRHLRGRRLTARQILQWVKQHRQRTGSWPHDRSGPIQDVPGMNWKAVESALSLGLRGLPGGDSLSRLLHRYVGKPKGQPLIRIPHTQILKWADAYHRGNHRWPHANSGPVAGVSGMTWSRINTYLSVPRPRRRSGPGGNQTLAKLLHAHRGESGKTTHPPFKLTRILDWARAFHSRTDRWPTIDDADSKTGWHWSSVNYALMKGRVNGIPPGTRLSLLLSKRCGAPYRSTWSTPLSTDEILTWARRHHERTRSWPTRISGRVVGGPKSLTWSSVQSALSHGRFGLRKGRSLAQLLDSIRGVPSDAARKRPLKVQEVLLWAKAHARRRGQWPEKYDGRIMDAKGETWFEIDEAFRLGLRGLPKVKSLGLLFSGLPRPRPVAIAR